jgi:hypothetical protein
MGVTLLASVRPDSWNFALFIHVAGAMILFGGLVTAAGAGILGWRETTGGLRRLAALTLFAVALPGWLIMRVGAEWIYSKEGWDDVPDKLTPSWLDIGFITADIGGIILLVALIVGGIGVRRTQSGGGAALLRTTTVLAAALVVVYVVAVWAMGGKPS